MNKCEYKISTDPPFTRFVTANGAHWTPWMLWEALWSKVIPMASKPGESKLLDLGCAAHAWTLSDFVVERADINHGLSQNGITSANKFIYVNCDSPEPWPIQQNAYEVVTAVDIIEHLENPWHLFRELMRITRKCAIITTPDVESRLSVALYEKTGCLFGFTPVDRQFAHHITPIFGWQIQTMASRARCTLSEHSLYGIPWQKNPMLHRGIINAGGEELLGLDPDSANTSHHRIFIVTKPH